ncbi:unnamed protein product [Parnassius apollo]|uniref:(apollo) hypothetical protein n=1 Tax=Parnassius apollo TaxID=110799 RepID=A0A8S3W2H4_PARAO|nr:unnamed protein product [Parnassius apollo]
MTICAVKSCKNYSWKKDKDKNITFHKFPTDPVTSSRWTEIIRRARNESWWKPKERTCICSVHFHVKDTYTTKSGRRRIRSGAVPTKALYISSIISDDDETENLNEDDDIPSNLDGNSEELVEKNLNESSTSTGQKTGNNESAITNQEEEPEIQSSDLESILDTPKKAKLRKELRRKSALQMKHVKKIKLLQQKNRRLRKEMPPYDKL